ncbi:7-cyano-7-deazaguanine synthase QueC [Psychrosphaera sp. 1_MG-2023]|uniref:7-cyano-7-deazaguanine synthase n=1 Tax=Psychrosphaera algicola TaxID=3023714 RepID=A0ABT5F9Z0_9GAMM|nr:MULTISPECIES: 7-cyano-7-deazaguanine synthase QueC [unclassified Psychrosphaera]MDC2887959.1 7-cyano-7-deazaguanine synthase QueC [Psychrosphaera sp. G1-22]MDO6718077.1 7-cyano-7-deazaguanine synthase QueC [Psychrosphaera sp. 1_MG-2023]
MSDKAVVIFSGGMDSFTVLNRAIRDGLDVYALTFDYGQRHVKEVNFAQNACEKLGVQHKIVDISAIGGIIAGSSLTANIDVPEGHYEAESMKQTVVPNRNMILLSLAVGYAVSLEASKVYYGAHSGDHAIYPDCRPEFVKKMQDVCAISNYDPIDIVVPYLESSKIDILKDGLKMGLDYGLTWTCYNGREHACGKCGACQERLEAFEKNNVTDPLTYEV